MDRNDKQKSEFFFNRDIYLKRLLITAETFLLEANQRGEEFDRNIFVHVVGLSLGVWMIDASIQGPLFCQAFEMALDNLLQIKEGLARIKRIDFSWIPDSYRPEGSHLIQGKTFKNSQIQITFSKRDPFAMDDENLSTEADKKWLLVALYAWDGNAFPGMIRKRL